MTMEKQRKNRSSSNLKNKSNLNYSMDNFLKLENTALKKKNRDIIRKIVDLKAKYRELENDRNSIHKDNANLRMQLQRSVHRNQPVQKIAKEVCDNLIKIFQAGQQELVKLYQALDSNYDQFPNNLCKDVPSLAQLTDVESQLLKSATGTSVILNEDNENCDPNTSYHLRNDQLDSINEESVKNASDLMENSSSNIENSITFLPHALSILPKNTDKGSLKRRNICSILKPENKTLESICDESISLLTNPEDEPSDKLTDASNEKNNSKFISPGMSSLDVDFKSFNAIPSSTSTPYNIRRKEIRRSRIPLNDLSSSITSLTTKEFSECCTAVESSLKPSSGLVSENSAGPSIGEKSNTNTSLQLKGFTHCRVLIEHFPEYSSNAVQENSSKLSIISGKENSNQLMDSRRQLDESNETLIPQSIGLDKSDVSRNTSSFKSQILLNVVDQKGRRMNTIEFENKIEHESTTKEKGDVSWKPSTSSSGSENQDVPQRRRKRIIGIDDYRNKASNLKNDTLERSDVNIKSSIKNEIVVGTPKPKGRPKRKIYVDNKTAKVEKNAQETSIHSDPSTTLENVSKRGRKRQIVNYCSFSPIYTKSGRPKRAKAPGCMQEPNLTKKMRRQ